MARSGVGRAAITVVVAIDDAAGWDGCAEGSFQKLCNDGWFWTGDGCGDGAEGMVGMESAEVEAGGEKVW